MWLSLDLSDFYATLTQRPVRFIHTSHIWVYFAPQFCRFSFIILKPTLFLFCIYIVLFVYINVYLFVQLTMRRERFWYLFTIITRSKNSVNAILFPFFFLEQILQKLNFPGRNVMMIILLVHLSFGSFHCSL